MNIDDVDTPYTSLILSEFYFGSINLKHLLVPRTEELEKIWASRQKGFLQIEIVKDAVGFLNIIHTLRIFFLKNSPIK